MTYLENFPPIDDLQLVAPKSERSAIHRPIELVLCPRYSNYSILLRDRRLTTCYRSNLASAFEFILDKFLPNFPFWEVKSDFAIWHTLSFSRRAYKIFDLIHLCGSELRCAPFILFGRRNPLFNHEPYLKCENSKIWRILFRAQLSMWTGKVYMNHDYDNQW